MSSQLKTLTMYQMTTYTLPINSVLREKLESNLINRSQAINSKHLCLCCANILLRHIRSNRLYWRCNHCCQIMPVLEDNLK